MSESILSLAAPGRVVGVDPSPAFVAFARDRVKDARVEFEAGDAQALGAASATYDAVVAGLVLNFVPDPDRAVSEMARVTHPGGTVAAYVWDYAEGMQLIRHFWDAAGALDPKARELDEGRRCALCKPDPLAKLFRGTGLGNVEVSAIEVPTVFRDFGDFWSPFLGGQAPAPAYAMSLSQERRAALRERIRAGLPTNSERAPSHRPRLDRKGCTLRPLVSGPHRERLGCSARSTCLTNSHTTNKGGLADARSSTRIDRGDVFWIGPDGPQGPVPGYSHPHVVVQDDVFNRSRITTVVVCGVVCTLTSNLHRANEPGNVLLDVGEGNLPKRSVVVVSQVSSVEKARLGERIGALSEARVEQILAGLRFQQASFFGQ